MAQINAAPIITPGFRAREQGAKDRAEKRVVAPDVRAERAAMLYARDAAMAAASETEDQKATRPAELFRELLLIAPTDLLEENQRAIVRLDTRQMIDLIQETLTERRRARHKADIAASCAPARKPFKAA